MVVQKGGAGAVRVLLQTNGGKDSDVVVVGTTLGAKAHNFDSRIDKEAPKLQQRTPMFDKKKAFERVHAASEELGVQ